jgi:uncharacterized membrane protein YgcG
MPSKPLEASTIREAYKNEKKRDSGIVDQVEALAQRQIAVAKAEEKKQEDKAKEQREQYDRMEKELASMKSSIAAQGEAAAVASDATKKKQETDAAALEKQFNALQKQLKKQEKAAAAAAAAAASAAAAAAAAASKKAAKAAVVQSDVFGSVSTKNVVFIVDLSGSMQGQRIEYITQDLRKTISLLPQGSTFNIFTYSDRPGRYRDGWCTAPDSGVDAYISKMRADGGTNPNPAIHGALSLSGVKEVHLMCDGGSISASDVHSMNFQNVPIHTVAIDCAADGGTETEMKQIALQSNGRHRSISANSGGGRGTRAQSGWGMQPGLRYGLHPGMPGQRGMHPMHPGMPGWP